MDIHLAWGHLPWQPVYHFVKRVVGFLMFLFFNHYSVGVLLTLWYEVLLQYRLKLRLIIITIIFPTVLELKFSSVQISVDESCRGPLCRADWLKVFSGNWRQQRLIEVSSSFLKEIGLLNPENVTAFFFFFFLF